jgi:hypothetical protein
MHTVIQAKSSVQSLRAETPIALHDHLGCALKPRRLQTVALHAIARLGVPLLLAIPLSSFAYLAAQTAAPSQVPQSPHTAHKPTHAHGRPSAAHPADPAPTPVPPAPPQPELPKWPVNEKAGPATVVWDSQGLRIEATNSSLEQILSDVSADTGSKVEGLDNDQRIFGTFGPGTAREVLAQLLEGSGYNFLMIGDQGQGTPREIVLSVRTAGSTIQGGKSPTPSEEDEVDEQPQQPQPPEGMPPPNRAGFPPRALQQRLQQQREQQGQQQGDPPNQQPGEPPK